MGPSFRGGAGSPYDRKKLYRRIHNRLDSQAAFADVRYEPSRTRPRTVLADVDPTEFVDASYPLSTARLQIEFTVRRDWNQYWIQWIEPDRDFALGWHQDSTHSDLGKCHVQIDYPDGSVDREPATFLNGHPLKVVETRLEELPTELLSLDIS